MEQYNEQQTVPSMRLHDKQHTLFLQESIRTDEHLHQVTDKDTLRITHREPPLTYPEYLQLLQSRAGILNTMKPRHTCRVSLTQIVGSDDELDSEDNSDDMLAYIVKEVQQLKTGHCDVQLYDRVRVLKQD